MGVMFDLKYVPDLMLDPKKRTLLAEATAVVEGDANNFVVQHFSTKYKAKVESNFTLYGVKWSLKMHAKSTFTRGVIYGDFIVHNTTALLTDVKSGDVIEITVINPNAKQFIQMILSFVPGMKSPIYLFLIYGKSSNAFF